MDQMSVLNHHHDLSIHFIVALIRNKNKKIQKKFKNIKSMTNDYTLLVSLKE